MVNSDLLEKLNSYCNELIGVVPPKPKRIKKQKQISCTDTTIKVTKEQPNQTLQNKKNVPELPSSKEESSTKITDDGFKIISQIPSDDSDISDAFCSDVEEMNEGGTKQKSQETEDGFKIISDIPPDDSDISDAFESDLDDSQWLSEARERHKKKKKDNSKAKKHSITDYTSTPDTNQDQSKFSTVKRPLMKLIEDFDLKDKLFLNEKSEPRLNSSCPSSPNEPQKKKCLSNKELTITDYSSKEKRKKGNEYAAKLENSSKTPELSQEDVDASFKKARYEIFKFGLSGFKKHDRKNAKVDLAIKLGAKPPGKKSINYKRLIEQRKSQKQKQIAQREEQRAAGLPVKKAQKERQKWRNDNPTNINPPVGKFKGGLLTLSKKDLHKIK